MSTTVHSLTTHDELTRAYEGSWYTILGVAGVQEFIEGYQEIFDTHETGTPEAWYETTGAAINRFIGTSNAHPSELFQDDLHVLMFPLTGLNVGSLAAIKLGMQDRWFDDIVDNTRRRIGRS